MSVQTQINRINGEVAEQATLLSQIQSALQGKAAGSGSSDGGLETCNLTIKQQWGGNDDPENIYLCVSAYDLTAGCTPHCSLLHSNDDNEPEHSVTLQVYKNIPIALTTYTAGGGVGSEKITVTTTGATLDSSTYVGSYSVYVWQFIPTGDNATVTFFSE